MGVKKRNVIARDLASAKYRARVVKPRKGRGAYVRRAKHDNSHSAR